MLFRSSLPRHTIAAKDQRPTTIPEALRDARMVLVRADAVRPPLAPRYDGPYAVIARSDQFFTLRMGDRTDTVSTSRLKPAPSRPHRPSRPGGAAHRRQQMPPPPAAYRQQQMPPAALGRQQTPPAAYRRQQMPPSPPSSKAASNHRQPLPEPLNTGKEYVYS